jgi:hypothetical protein
MAHARRKFVAASEGGDEGADSALERIGRLYGIERELPPLLSPSDDPVAQHQRRLREEQRREMRKQQAEPVLAELKKWLDEQSPGALPKTLLGKGLGYGNRQAKGTHLGKQTGPTGVQGSTCRGCPVGAGSRPCSCPLGAFLLLSGRRVKRRRALLASNPTQG